MIYSNTSQKTLQAPGAFLVSLQDFYTT